MGIRNSKKANQRFPCFPHKVQEKAKSKIFHYNFFPKNRKAKMNFSIPRILPNSRKAWIRIFEAVIAVLLITSILLIVIGQGSVKKNEDSSKIYKEEISILREIQLNNSLREDILGIESLPVGWDEFDSNGLGDIKDKIILKTPDYLNCTAMACEINYTCILNENLGKEIYVQSIAITANLTKYDPRLLKLFCWKV